MAMSKEMISEILKTGMIRGKQITSNQRILFEDILSGKRKLPEKKKKDIEFKFKNLGDF